MSSVKLSNTLYYGVRPKVAPEYHVDNYVGLSVSGEMPYIDYSENATWISFPIKDRKAVTIEKLKEIVDYINLLKGVVYIYSKDGNGRSGMIAAAVYGQRNGLTGKEALKHVNKEWKKQRDMNKMKPVVRKLGSPQTNNQKKVVEEFLDNLRPPVVIITADRHYNNHEQVREFLGTLQKNTVIVHGEAKGVGTLVDDEANKLGLTVKVKPTNWQEEMLEEGPDLVAGFHDDIDSGKGTKNMLNIANNADVDIILFQNGIETRYFYKQKGRFGPLTNFYKLKKGLDINGEHFIDTEQYYQVMKFRGPNATPRMLEYANLIKLADSPMKTKMLGSQKKNLRFGSKWKLNKQTDDRLVNDLVDEYKDVKYRSDWNVAGLAVMLSGLYHKYTQYPELYQLLTQVPDNIYFVEHTTRDKIWGDGGDFGTGTVGQNRLGKILTALSFCLKHGNCDSIPPALKEKIKIAF